MIAPAVATHLCVGSPYGWSIVGEAITREFGVVGSTSMDWSFADAAYPISVNFAFMGLTAAFSGTWQLKVGLKKSLLTGAALFSSGLAIGALGIHLHSLPLLYAGYGVLGGIGVGLSYTPPVQTLLKWFPDRRGLVSGICIGAFGSAALVFGPTVTWLMSKFAKVPTFIGNDENLIEANEGHLWAKINGAMQEVVHVTAKELSHLPFDGLQEGYYLAGTGSTGAAMALGTMAAAYCCITGISPFLLKNPPEGFMSDYKPSAKSTRFPDNHVLDSGFVAFDKAARTPQIFAMTAILFCSASGGIGLISVAKPMMSQVFSGAMPDVVTGAFTSSFVMALSFANLSGRLAWGAISDVIGRRRAFWILTGSNVPLFMAIPSVIDTVMETRSPLALYAFIACCFTAVSTMGAVLALLPPYQADTFGAKNVGAIQGRVMLGKSGAALLGPFMLLKFREYSEAQHVRDLIKIADPSRFEDKFGVPITEASRLLESKGMSLSKLMQVVPPGTIDPSPYIYNNALYAMSGLMALALISQASIRKIDPKLVEFDQPPAPPTQNVTSTQTKS